MFTIKASDRPIGFASYNAAVNFGGYGGTVVTVNTAADLKAKAKLGNHVIYVNGMIDISEGMLPATFDGTTTALNSFISTKTGGAYTTYLAWRTAYGAACSKTTDITTGNTTLDGYQTALVSAWKTQIQIVVASNTTIIGLTNNSGIRGGTISLSSVSNVALRNLIIEDPYDPFPRHEANDGFNAQYDGITSQGTNKNIWIDHCTFRSTISANSGQYNFVTLSDGSTSEKWQTYDGLCDFKGTQEYITVSFCKFQDHDKTMLIGSSTSDTGKKQITLMNNWFYGCAQRLPMVRLTDIHIFNNYFSTRSGGYANSYAVGVREISKIVAENNHFSSGIKNSFTSTQGDLYISGNVDNSSSGNASMSVVTSTKPWNPSLFYTYTLLNAADLPTIAVAETGAGVGDVVQ